MQNIQEYISNINTQFRTGIATEHSYRGDLQALIESIGEDILVTNEPSRIACGAPDYIITRKNIPIGYIEAKDIGVDLKNKIYKEQFDRYLKSLNNLIITNYLEFQFYKDGQLVTSITLGEIQGKKIIPRTEKFTEFNNLITEFCTYIGQTIKSASKLSKMMAGKARLLADVIENALNEDDHPLSLYPVDTLMSQLKAFKEILIHDITIREFADIYAQTIAYGMFAARLHDPSLENFSRNEAAELIPKSNPFLRKLFQYIAGYDLDDRIKWIVDALADIFRATDIRELLKDFGKATQQNDPMIHFYETFLSEYDPKLRKSRGVWYTPEPVVNFIVRAVDDILKDEFGIKQGLADTSKVKIKVDFQGKKIEEEFHKVQILDPAAGTGTFLAEVIKQIYKKFENQQGIWSNYVEEHLIPRLNGFEILMASYAMAHLKLDILLKETGYTPIKEQRFRVYLTNSLEEFHPDTGTLFANWLSAEANEANCIKRDTPVMVVLGNPPYSGESVNKGEWIMNLMEDYKREPGGKEKLKEKNPKWINDDYVKFIRYGQHFIEKNGSGILSFINAHGFLDNPTFRGMRWNLLKTYDKIFIIDLHGNAKKKEITPGGSVDENVFDIQQGVSINLFVKTGKKRLNELGNIFHFDLYGKREDKYNFLFSNSIKTVGYKKIENIPSNYFFTKKDFDFEDKYGKGINIQNLFGINNVGIVTSRDTFVVDDNEEMLKYRVKEFFNVDNEILKQKYGLKENKNWKIDEVKIKAKCFNPNAIKKVNYRPFDTKFLYYEDNFIERSRKDVMCHFRENKNVGLIIGRQGQVVGSMQWNLVFITNTITDFNLYYRGGGNVFPLYLYSENSEQQTFGQNFEIIPNLNRDIVNEITKKLNLQFTNEREENGNTFAPIDILDYIYAILHSPTYREKYKEFLKIDFPRIPFPKDRDTFWKFVELGSQLRQIHLLESHIGEKYITSYPISGTNEVDKIKYEENKVWINEKQYFDKIPDTAWNFYIGGYQPAQKWLKDRRGRQLSFEDVLHYQKIIAALVETDRLMNDIDKIEFE